MDWEKPGGMIFLTREAVYCNSLVIFYDATDLGIYEYLIRFLSI